MSTHYGNHSASRDWRLIKLGINQDGSVNEYLGYTNSMRNQKLELLSLIKSKLLVFLDNRLSRTEAEQIVSGCDVVTLRILLEKKTARQFTSELLLYKL